MPRKNQYAAGGPVIPGKRPAPPPGLDERERAIWSDVTRRLPADWFGPDNAPALKELCRHIRHSEDLSADLAQARAALDRVRAEPARDPVGKLAAEAMKQWLTLLRAHGYQSERVGNLSTKLRLTPQSRYQAISARSKAEAARAASAYPEPWNDWGNAADDESGSEPEFDEQNGPKLKQ